MWFNIRFNLFHEQVGKIKFFFERHYIAWRLTHEHKSLVESIKVTERFYRYRNYLRQKESKEAYRCLMDFIGEWSETSGIPQWKVRGMIDRDFHIDV